MHNDTSRSPSSMRRSCITKHAATLAKSSITPLGSPVVPEV